MTVGARHAGLVLALALIAPLLSETPGLDDKALLAGAQVVLEGNADLRQKVPIALDLRDALDEAKKGEIPDLARPFDERGAARTGASGRCGTTSSRRWRASSPAASGRPSPSPRCSPSSR